MLPMIEANDLSAGGDRLLSVSDSLFSTNQSIAAFQAVCVTRFNQSECVIFGVDFVLEKSSFERYTS